MAKKKLSPRTERRTRAHTLEKLARDRDRLARIEPGGTPERPIALESASQVEPHALAMACVRCDGPNRLEEHAAENVGGEMLRVTRLSCARCGWKRELWFRIQRPLPS